MLNMEMASDVNVDGEQIEGMLAAIAPIVGSARVASAGGEDGARVRLELSLAELAEQQGRVAAERYPPVRRERQLRQPAPRGDA